MEHNLIRLKIENTTSYRGKVYVRNDELTVDAKTADGLVEREIASILGEEAVTESKEDAEELAGMTVEELREYAAEAGIELKGVTKKAEIIAAIRGEL